MSGHSKWATIKRAKGAADVRRGQLFTKLARGITIAAREGGGDPVMNFKLRLTIDKARSYNMPKDGIDRAIARGIGADKDAAVIEEGLYEGFGPGKVGVLVTVATDNKNRTAGDIKLIFSKNNGAIAGSGSVKWHFEQKGVIRIHGALTDEQELMLIDAGADDIRKEAEGTTICTAIANFRGVNDALAKGGITPVDSGLEWAPKDTVAIDDATRAQLGKLFEALDEHDDVQDLYSNEI